MFKTTDLYLAAFLINSGQGLERIESINEKQKAFVFDNEEKSEAISRDYYNGGTVEALPFKKVLNDLKKQLFAC